MNKTLLLILTLFTLGTEKTPNPTDIPPPVMYFEPNSVIFSLSPCQEDVLKDTLQAIEWINSSVPQVPEEMKILIEGHTDKSENSSGLGLRRAEKIKSMLIKSGMDSRRLTCVDLNTSEPNYLTYEVDTIFGYKGQDSKLCNMRVTFSATKND